MSRKNNVYLELTDNEISDLTQIAKYRKISLSGLLNMTVKKMIKKYSVKATKNIEGGK